MNNIRFFAYGFFVLSLIISESSSGQGKEPFETRLADINNQLNMLSDSLVPGLNETANFSVSGISMQSFLRTVAENHRLNIQIDPSVNITLTNNFTNVLVKDLLYFLCQEYRLDIRFTNTIMSFLAYKDPVPVVAPSAPRKLSMDYDHQSGRITFDLANDSLEAVVREITRISNKNVVVAGSKETEGKRVRGFIKELPLENALDKLAYTNGLRLTKTKDGVYIFEGMLPTQGVPGQNPNRNMGSSQGMSHGDVSVSLPDSLISMDVVSYPIMDIVNQASVQLGINYILFTELTGNTTVKVKGITYSDLLSLLFQGTNFTFKRRDGVYLIGQRTQEGFRSSELIKLYFRTIEDIEKNIPADLAKEVEIKIVKELNALVFTGSQHKIEELISFIKLIDQPIPNILIEVIVAEANKNFTINTGIKAFISDSIPKTSGQIFPGLDVTLSTKSINDFLNEVDSRGIVNVGRVSPRFYATLQALERNENIQIRSTPKLSTINGSKANLTIGRSQYYAEQTQNITGGVAPIQSTTTRYNKVDANLSITISPVVSGNEHITLDIVAEFSDFNTPVIEGAPPGNTTRKFESKIRVRNEETIVLGGFEEVRKSEGSSGVPLLSRIPVLKWIFSSRQKSRGDTHLIVFIKPTLVY